MVHEMNAETRKNKTLYTPAYKNDKTLSTTPRHTTFASYFSI